MIKIKKMKLTEGRKRNISDMYEFMLERNWEPWQWMSLSQVGEQTLEWRQLLFPMYKIENSLNVKFSLFQHHSIHKYTPLFLTLSAFFIWSALSSSKHFLSGEDESYNFYFLESTQSWSPKLTSKWFGVWDS